MKVDFIEVRRKVIHIFFGCLVVALIAFGEFPLPYVLGALVIGTALSMLFLERRTPWMMRIMDLFERNHAHPGKGLVTFNIGALLALLFFDLPLALAAILVLTFGDSLNGLVGPYGRVKTMLSPTKNIEGTIAGMIGAFLAATAFLPLHEAAAAAIVGMIIEPLEIRVNGARFPDNVSIPVAAGLGVLLLRSVLPLH